MTTIQPNTFARIIADTSHHGLPAGTIVAVEAVRDPGPIREAAPYAMVQPGNLAVFLRDLEPFNPLAPTPESPIIVNGQPVTGTAPATFAEEDPEFAAAMAALSALFTGEPETRSEPSITLDNGGNTPGAEATIPGAMSSGATAVVEPDGHRAVPYPEEERDTISGRDGYGDPMWVKYRAAVCPDHGVEGVVIFKAPNTFAMPVEHIPALIGHLRQFMARHAERQAQNRKNGGS